MNTGVEKMQDLTLFNDSEFFGPQDNLFATAAYKRVTKSYKSRTSKELPA